jgi:hypothetical protein
MEIDFQAEQQYVQRPGKLDSSEWMQPGTMADELRAEPGVQAPTEMPQAAHNQMCASESTF